jgi:hypothetical protein
VGTGEYAVLEGGLEKGEKGRKREKETGMICGLHMSMGLTLF